MSTTPPRTLQENGKTFVVLPIADYQHLIARQDDSEDIAAFDAAVARSEESFPVALFDAIDAGAHPILVFRRHRGMKQRELAAKSGLSKAFVSQIETGARKGSVNALKAIAEALDVPLDMLT